MRTEFIEYAFLSEADRQQVSLPPLDANRGELESFWNTVQTIKGLREEQPDCPALPADGELRVDVPLSIAERSEA